MEDQAFKWLRRNFDLERILNFFRRVQEAGSTSPARSIESSEAGSTSPAQHESSVDPAASLSPSRSVDSEAEEPSWYSRLVPVHAEKQRVLEVRLCVCTRTYVWLPAYRLMMLGGTLFWVFTHWQCFLKITYNYC